MSTGDGSADEERKEEVILLALLLTRKRVAHIINYGINQSFGKITRYFSTSVISTAGADHAFSASGDRSQLIGVRSVERVRYIAGSEEAYLGGHWLQRTHAFRSHL
ncbi:unnamed protein product [Euphydryas editha]|uniref:Uncharacterized protein n=1 Tax=Euphydryas editha TaxID=104508 RepID=A0AAU9TRT6_EUPED|nr:unnamed protein product [Euphydryas editha]